MKRFNTITSLPNVMKVEDYTIPKKEYDESIVDKSCFSPLSEQLKTIQPMTPSEAEQHFHFVDGIDTGMKPPLPPSADIAEVSNAIREGQKAVKKTIDKAVEKTQQEMRQKAEAQAIIDKSR